MSADPSQDEIRWLCKNGLDKNLLRKLEREHPYPLTNDVAYCPRKDNIIVLISKKIEVLLHP